jgi:hypothetical protein
MAQWLKQSTATTVLLGPFVDETDGKTAETALTISQSDVLLWKEGGTSMAAKNDATSATHRASGYYTVPLDSTDTGTLGALTVAVHESGALPVRHEFFVVPAAVYDAIKAGTGNGVRADIANAQSGVITAAAIATGAIDADALAEDASTELVAAIKAMVVETNDSITLGQALSVILAACAGVTTTSGGVFKDPSGTDTRITATLNSSNERTAITLAPSA